MAKGALSFDAPGEHFYETGVNHCVLFLYDSVNKNYGTSSSENNVGVAWNGITSISESPEGADITDIYADNIKYLSLQAAETFKATVEAYTYPKEFMECDGSKALLAGVYFGQQARKQFGIAYTTREGNDSEGDQFGEKLHLIYGCKAKPSQRQYQTVNDSPEAISFSWEISTTPVTFKNPADDNKEYTTANITISKTDLLAVDETKGQKAWDAICAAIYGQDAGGSGGTAKPSYLPLPAEVYTIINTALTAN